MLTTVCFHNQVPAAKWLACWANNPLVTGSNPAAAGELLGLQPWASCLTGIASPHPGAPNGGGYQTMERLIGCGGHVFSCPLYAPQGVELVQECTAMRRVPCLGSYCEVV